jgi:hypothetical protein
MGVMQGDVCPSRLLRVPKLCASQQAIHAAATHQAGKPCRVPEDHVLLASSC